ncbi:MAG: Decaprenyl diphosphate synthase, partial [uncultured Acetobacteraceae bacterium]
GAGGRVRRRRRVGCAHRARGRRPRSLQPADRGPDAQPGRAHPAIGGAHRGGRRQAAAAVADLGGGEALRPPRAAARGVGRLRGVHPHRDPAARRRGGRERAAPRPGQRQRAVRQQAERAGGRLPVRPRLPAHGGRRVAEGAGDPVRGRRDHRRGRGAPARHAERHRDHGGAVPPGRGGQDGGAVRRGRARRRRGGRPAGGGGTGAPRLRPQPRHRLPARGRRARLLGGAGTAGQDGRRRFPRRQDHPAGAAGAGARHGGGERLLAPHVGGARPRAGRPAARAGPHARPRRVARHRGTRPLLRRRGAVGAGALPARPGADGARGHRGVLHRTGAL